jgi:hypothetical protein
MVNDYLDGYLLNAVDHYLGELGDVDDVSKDEL